MQRLASWQLLAQLCAKSSQLSRAAAAAPIHQLPSLASFCGHRRGFASGDAGSGGPLAEADAAAAAAEADGAEDGAAAADGGEVAEEFNPDEWKLTPKGLAKALAFRGGVPDRRGRRPTREEKGSYIDNADLDAELTDISIKVPEDVPLYDLNTAAPGLNMPRSKALDKLLQYGEEHMAQLLEDMGAGADAENPLLAGERPILRWLVRMRLDTSGLPNPVNRKAVCKVYLRELQEEAGLTDAALRHIALVCGTRYNPNTGELTLISERYPEREENRVDIMETLHALIAEGERVHPSEPAVAEAAHAGA